MGNGRIGQDPVAKIEDIGSTAPLDQHLFNAPIKGCSACSQKQGVKRALDGRGLLKLATEGC
jgi:hypothetical protein